MSKSEDLQKYLTDLTSVETSLKEWIEPRQSTLVWKVRERLVAQSTIAAETRKSAEGRLQNLALPKIARIEEMRKQFTSTIRNVFIAEVVILSIYFLVRALIPAAGLWLNLANFGILRVVLWMTYFFVATYVSALLVYYRNWSSYYRQVRIANNEIVSFVAELNHLEDEEQRLKSVHEQAISWYQLLSMTLLKPWEIGSKWLEDPSLRLKVEQIPLAVRFGRAHSGSRAIANTLERSSLESLLIQGWRTEALNELITQSAVDLGLDPNGFDIRTLDGDLPEASNGSRRTFISQLRQSIAERAGDIKVRQLASEIREQIIPRLATPVKSLHPDSLEELDWTYGGADDDSWSGFYSEIFGKPHLKAPAFSVLPLTEVGMVEKVHEAFDTYAIVPKQTIVEEDGVSILRIDDKSPRWIDLSVRIDLTGPHTSNNFKIIKSDSDEAPTEVFNADVVLLPDDAKSHPEDHVTFDATPDSDFN
jgi:hypothetical protein